MTRENREMKSNSADEAVLDITDPQSRPKRKKQMHKYLGDYVNAIAKGGGNKKH